MRKLSFLVLGALFLSLSASAQTIRIGSKNFTEAHLLGEMLTLLIEEHTEFEAEHKSSLGGTLVCFTALTQGEIDIYPEYTGTAWAVILEQGSKVNDPLKAFLATQHALSERHDVEMLQPFGLNNTYAIAVEEALGERLSLRTLSDLSARAGELRAGFSMEFMNREDGYPGLQAFYGMNFANARGMEHGLAYEALAKGSIDVVDAYSTDAKLLRYQLRTLEDDRSFFPPYHAAPLVRGELLERHPELRAVLELLAFRISDERMIALNHAVEVDGRLFKDVAGAFLADEGLLEAKPDAAVARGKSGWVAYFVERRHDTLRFLWEHIQLTLLSVFLASLIAVPLGILITRNDWANRIALGLASILQTIPSLALLAFLIAVPGLGLSTKSAVCALTLYALLPILRNTFTGISGVDGDLVDAARGMGLTERQILLRIQLPLATRTIMAGIRTATVITIGFATLAAFIGAGGLGEPIVTGLYLNDIRLILTGALPAALLAILADTILGKLELRLTPGGGASLTGRTEESELA